MKSLIQKLVGQAGYKLARIGDEADTPAKMFARLCALRSAIRDGPLTPERAFLQRCCGHLGESQSQLFQDVFVDFVLDGAPGVYCEFGATDGLTFSNTHLLERRRAWRGILAEPALVWREALCRNRPQAKLDFRCIYSTTGRQLDFKEVALGELSTIADLRNVDGHAAARRAGRTYPVETVSLNDLMLQHGVERLDYLSVDTEGSELDILTAFDFKQFAPKIITVEHNFTVARQQLWELLSQAGYIRVFEQFSSFDDWYVAEPFAFRCGS